MTVLDEEGSLEAYMALHAAVDPDGACFASTSMAAVIWHPDTRTARTVWYEDVTPAMMVVWAAPDLYDWWPPAGCEYEPFAALSPLDFAETMLAIHGPVLLSE